MTEKLIAEVIGKDRVLSGHVICCDKVSLAYKGEQDFISVTKSGYLIEYEIKISRGDFFKDIKKDREFRHMIGLTSEKFIVPNQLYYVVPIGLVDIEEVPDFAGLMYVTEKGVLYSKKKAPMIHNKKNDILKILRKVTTVYQQRKFLGCCLLTYNNNEIKRKNSLRDQYRDQFNSLSKTCLDPQHEKKVKKYEPCPFPVGSCQLCQP